MFKTVLNLLFLFFSINIKAQTRLPNNHFSILGKATGLDNKFIYILYNNTGGNNIKDSAQVKNGSFNIKGNISEPTVATLTSTSKPDWAENGKDISPLVFIEPKALTVEIKEGNFKNLKMFGSKTQNENLQLEQKKSKIYNSLKPFGEAYNNLNNEYIKLSKAKAGEASLKKIADKMDSIRNVMAPFLEKAASIDKAFFKENPGSYVTAYMLRYYVSSLSLNDLKSYYNHLLPVVRQSKFGREVKDEIEKLMKGSPGSTASIFKTLELKGDSLRLEDYRGKYVLLDFWASWCRPCREGNPHLINLYNKYNGKGIEFIGVSDDDGHEDKWKEAVQKDGIGIWKHVLRGMKATENNPPDFTNDISSKYGIHTLPTKILIDKNGVIIGRYGNEEEDHKAMDKKLEELLGG
ncbi:MAG: TlpA disulfide reductase family protein [Segetibacter sp.]